MELRTPRLILRSFREDDVDAMAQLFANPDFMRFSLGVYTERKQTFDFIEKVTAGIARVCPRCLPLCRVVKTL
jgi:RimJ/RimL family protein N-acetyltransferase